MLVGHNLHRFDRPQIAERAPRSPLLDLPTVDTLELSVLAFPRRPYHRLTKDDRLVRDARPNPLSDVRAAEQVHRDALAALADLPGDERAVLVHLLDRTDHPPHARAGWAHTLGHLGWRPTPVDLARRWSDRVCVHSPTLAEPPYGLPLLFLSAWLRVARHADGSVLPRWVRRTWPQTAALARALRATPCGRADCTWCSTMLSPEHWLEEVFAFPSFRATPATPDGRSLQRELVLRGLRGEPTFGILPTGGGKSLCFQVPAEARYRLLGQLTLVVSPLRALMKDQVDNLQSRLPHARALYGGVPSVMRPVLFEAVRSGACGLLYLSPEQLRNASVLRLLRQRELGAVVFDEAHCLSQWGHDFRTDYPYVLRAIAELCRGEDQPIPPVFLFTATTQHDATLEILDHVEERTGQRPELLDGGSARANLRYEVQKLPAHARLDALEELLVEDVAAGGTAIVFCGTRKRTEQVAADLLERGHSAVAYHAGLDADTRRVVQDAFLRGEHRVIAATNAFGMGVDKPDVRLVVHLDMPSSLEAYLQEAGRGGRDGHPARAVLFWAPGDSEQRFALGARSDLEPPDLAALWRAIRQLPWRRQRDREVRVVTPRELLYLEACEHRFDPHTEGEETRVKAAVNWLERAGVLERRENVTRVFSGRPRRPDLASALAEVDRLDLPPPRAAVWRTVLEAVYRADEEGLSADELAVLARELSADKPLEGGLRVLDVLFQMARAGLVTTGQTFTAFVSAGVREGSRGRFDRWSGWEQELVERLREEHAFDGQVHLGAAAAHLQSEGRACLAADVARLLRTWREAGSGQPEARPLVTFRSRRDEVGRLELEVPAAALESALRIRRAVASVVLSELLARADGRGKDQLVAGELEELVDRVESDLTFRGLRSSSDAVRAAMSWLHELRVVTVQSGLAVFRSAMRLDREPAWPTTPERDASRALAEHHRRKVLRIHVVEAWARQMLSDPARAEQLQLDWFELAEQDFLARWFAGRKAEVERPTGRESFDAIVTALEDPRQEAIVTRDPRRSHLVLAGPGSGKTRVLVHRVAWLLRCKRVRAEHILVVCYTRANALELRQRLAELVGDDARFVTIRTLHAVALSLVGPHRLGADLDLDGCLREATDLLTGRTLPEDEDRVRQREALLRGRSHLLVDEYQDLDEPKYQLLSALAGRGLGADHRPLRVFAVGDDDQAIFSWDGSSADFIRSFETDYGAQRFVLPYSYRCPAALLELSEGLVRELPDRLKAGTALTVDPARQRDPPAGPWLAAHPRLRGHIPWRRSLSVGAAAHDLMAAVRQLLDEGVEPERIAVLTRTHRGGLYPLRLAAEAARLLFSWPLPSGETLPMSRIREVASLSGWLEDRGDRITADAIERWLADRQGPWADALRSWLAPRLGRTLDREQWRHDLYLWTRLERSARRLGRGVHLGTMHAAKGLEFDHVLLLDDGSLGDTPEDRRLLYVACTRARRSLQVFGPRRASGAFARLRHDLLDIVRLPPLAAEGPPPHGYGVIGRDDIWIDWLGLRPGGDPANTSLGLAQPGDPFTLVRDGSRGLVLDAAGVPVARLSAKGAQEWLPRLDRELRLKLVAVVEERADDAFREPAYRERLVVERWWTGVWEARWREVG